MRGLQRRPAKQEPPNWLKAVVLFIAALLVVVATAGKFNAPTTDTMALESTRHPSQKSE
jgi:hypothetical protein